MCPSGVRMRRAVGYTWVLALAVACQQGPAQTDGGAPDAGDGGCAIDVHGGPLSQTAARLGAFYFDGWSGGLSDYHLSQLIPGVDGANREPLSGWEDATACEVEQQVAWARSYGLSYFIFDWYYPPSLEPACGGECWYLNNALGLYRGLQDRHGLSFAVLYVDQDGFTVSAADWPDAVARWVDLFGDPDYVRVNGQPLFMVIDMYNMFVTFNGSHTQVKAALDSLRSAAQQKGLPGVYIVGGFTVNIGGAGDDSSFFDLSPYESEGYDAISTYTYGMSPPADAGPPAILDDDQHGPVDLGGNAGAHSVAVDSARPNWLGRTSRELRRGPCPPVPADVVRPVTARGSRASPRCH